LLVLALATAAGAAAVGYTYHRFNRNSAESAKDQIAPDQPSESVPPDPRLVNQSPFLNVNPKVKYVGDAACAGCHPKIAETYAGHPMGRSVAVKNEPPPERYTQASRNPFQFAGLTYGVEHQTGLDQHYEQVRDAQGRPLAEMREPISLIVGSGQNGRSYLVKKGDSLLASPICWYPRKQTWDLAPGYEKQNPHFGRPVERDCLFCHVNSVEPVGGATNRFRTAPSDLRPIGCERCHGPGELHVARWGQGEKLAGPDHTIVNPGRIDPPLREAVCQQCHLQGQYRVWRRGVEAFDFRPGLPLELFVTNFVSTSASTETKFVSSVEQMHLSRCFQKSDPAKKLGCISCHDPHQAPAPGDKVAHYRTRCVNCHEKQGCSLPLPKRLEQQKQDSCIACHMLPTGSAITHTAITDHRILRDARSMPLAPSGWEGAPDYPIMPFGFSPGGKLDLDASRDLGIALIRHADHLPSGNPLQALAGRALGLLDSALQRDDRDLAAVESRGNALWFLGRLDEAMGTYERVLALAPDRETTLFQAANLSFRLGRLEAARSFAQRLLTVNPWRWEYHLALARIQAQANDWLASRDSCLAARKLNALQPGVSRQLVVCHLRLRNRSEAETEFETLLHLLPAQAEELRRWFSQLR
jgi:hypothetical protein